LPPIDGRSCGSEGNPPNFTYRLSYGRGDHRRLRVVYRDPTLLKAIYRADPDDPICGEWDRVIEQLRERTGLPVKVTVEATPTEDEIAALAAEMANVQIVFNRRPGRD
jgi:hypothetical protein